MRLVLTGARLIDGLKEVVTANPLDDIDNVRRLRLVLKDGRVVADHRDRADA